MERLVNARLNRVLRCLSESDLALLDRYARPVRLHLRQRLEAANRPVTDVYFIYRGLVSVVAVSADRQHQSEVGLIGRDGMTGLAVIMGSETMPCDAFVQIEGDAMKIAACDLRRSMEQSPSLRAAFGRYVHVFAMQAAHTALANARGTIEQRLARWLLMAQDRVCGNELSMTHEFLALMLGVRRAGVTVTLHSFASRGLISTARREIDILDRRGLEHCAGGLYGAPELELDRVLPD
ncbi:Crp/Fnr family transcriptional regulator [Hyphomicrobium sp.]|uniref:Crp/Fnr family transcriptional regulator n=1 Tax=Hyphomicrobium sp. TaxID=82 RepID=UPI002FDE5B44